MRRLTPGILHKDSQNLRENLAPMSDMISVREPSSFQTSLKKVSATSSVVPFSWRPIK